MDFSHLYGAFCAVYVFSWGVAAHADETSQVAASSEYQVRRLLDPTDAELAAEREGAVYIYDSLDINQVDAGLDQQFERMQNMMFIRIQHLPPTGAGPAEVEDDGCD
jgi:hypothetical protein